MKMYLPVAALIGCLALASFSFPCAAQTVHYQGLYYQPGTGTATRIPRSTGGGAFVPIPNDSGSDPAGPLVPAGLTLFPPINPTYALAYTSITGTAAGSLVVFPSYASGFIPVTVGTQDIYVNYFYFLIGGGPPCTGTPCTTGADIDEFNEASGTLADDLFVSVFQPPSASSADPALTHSGNYEGVVNTTSNNVRINADQVPLNPASQAPVADGLLFDRWVAGPGATGWAIGSSANDLDVNSQTDVYALALYRAPCPSGYSWTTSPTINQCVQTKPKCPAGEVWVPVKVPGDPGATAGRCIVLPPRGCGSCPQGYKCSATLNDPPIPICIPNGTNPPSWPGGRPTPSVSIVPNIR